MIGAFLAGWEVIYGIEMEWEYARIAQARLAYYADPLRKMEMSVVNEPEPTLAQLDMFPEVVR